MQALEGQAEFQRKENDDLKHDNTVLYQKGAHNKERLDKLQAEVEDLKRFVDHERQRNGQLEAEVGRLQAKG